MKATFQADLEKAKKAAEDAQDAMTAAASKMFAFYLNLLSPKCKYVWNKIIIKQTESNPYVNLLGVSLKGPFNDCVMFHLLTMFPLTRQNKKSTTSPMYLRSPSTSMYVNLYVE